MTIRNNTSIKVGKYQIESFIPQRAPFIMIDNLLEATDEKIETDFAVLADNIFFEAGVLREFALIENIAQSSAAGLVFLNMSSNGKPVNGFLGGISKLKLYDLPKENDIIYTTVTQIQQFENMYLLKGENRVKNKKLLECEVKLVGILHQDNATQSNI